MENLHTGAKERPDIFAQFDIMNVFVWAASYIALPDGVGGRA